MGDRVVDCARLESVCAERHRGFESPPIRHLTQVYDLSTLETQWVDFFGFQNHFPNKYAYNADFASRRWYLVFTLFWGGTGASFFCEAIEIPYGATVVHPRFLIF